MKKLLVLLVLGFTIASCGSPTRTVTVTTPNETTVITNKPDMKEVVNEHVEKVQGVLIQTKQGGLWDRSVNYKKGDIVIFNKDFFTLKANHGVRGHIPGHDTYWEKETIVKPGKTN